MKEQYFRDRDKSVALGEKIQRIAGYVGSAKLMEVCGTHTTSFRRWGLGALTGGVRLLSGPGCPVCVTPAGTVAALAECARKENVIVATFGDMLHVPGGDTSLEKERAAGADVRIVYSPADALSMAQKNPEHMIVFAGVGFETTAPVVAATILSAAEKGIENFSVLSAHRVMPPALAALTSGAGPELNGFMCPGHVSAIIGSHPYEEIATRTGLPCVITGFEPLDMLQGILMLLNQVRDGRAEVEIQYSRVVRKEGNPRAVEMMQKVFEPEDAPWRGLGVIPGSGLVIRKEYEKYDALKRLDVEVPNIPDPKGCSCGEILRGRMLPTDCPLFSKACTPENPVGPCMVSSEGACSAYYRFGGDV